LRMM